MRAAGEPPRVCTRPARDGLLACQSFFGEVVVRLAVALDRDGQGLLEALRHGGPLESEDAESGDAGQCAAERVVQLACRGGGGFRLRFVAVAQEIVDRGQKESAARVLVHGLVFGVDDDKVD